MDWADLFFDLLEFAKEIIDWIRERRRQKKEQERDSEK